jgi:hypothetical protein
MRWRRLPMEFYYVFEDIEGRDGDYRAYWNSRIHSSTGSILLFDEAFGENFIRLRDGRIISLFQKRGKAVAVCDLNREQYQHVAEELGRLAVYQMRLNVNADYPIDVELSGKLAGLRKFQGFLEHWGTRNGCIIGGDPEPGQTVGRKTPVALRTATAELYEHSLGSPDRIEICREYLKTHDIKGKPEYTPELLSNNIAKYAIKLKNKEKAPR